MTLYKRIILFIAMAASASIAYVSAQQPEGNDPYAGYVEETFLDMDFDPNLATPAVPDRSKAAVCRYVRKVAEGLVNTYTVDLMRDGEVMVISVPTDDLFLPNDTLLAPGSEKVLSRLEPLFADAMMYKIVLSMNVDNTGSEVYRERKSLARLNSVYEWMLGLIDSGRASEDLIIVPFSMDDGDPMTDNNTRSSRKENRRVEFYFIPGPKMISQADSGQLQ